MAKKPTKRQYEDTMAVYSSFPCFMVDADGNTTDYINAEVAADDLDLNVDDIVNAILSGGHIGEFQFGWVL